MGNVVASQSFDAWGRKRNPNDGSYSNIPINPDWLYSGYTCHEQLNDLGLINMNGRMYDLVQGRMMSPDALINDQYSTQTFNMYSYAANNPLRFTDPSGYITRDELRNIIHDLGKFTNGGIWTKDGGSDYGGTIKAYAPDDQGGSIDAIVDAWFGGGFNNGLANIGDGSTTTWDQVKRNYYSHNGKDGNIRNLLQPVTAYGKNVKGYFQTTRLMLGTMALPLDGFGGYTGFEIVGGGGGGSFVAAAITTILIFDYYASRRSDGSIISVSPSVGPINGGGDISSYIPHPIVFDTGATLPPYPGDDPTVPPGEGWQWRGAPGSTPGSSNGSWMHPENGSLSPDLSHPAPIGPHWDYKDLDGLKWRLFPDGTYEQKKKR